MKKGEGGDLYVYKKGVGVGGGEMKKGKGGIYMYKKEGVGGGEI